MQRKNYDKKITLSDGSKLRIGVVVSEFNGDITENMLKGAMEVLSEAGVKKRNISVLRVPGSFEIPYGCLKLLESGKKDALIALGCVIKGETSHDQYITYAATNGIMNIITEYKIPIGFGIITTDNIRQAKARSSGKTNKGREAAIAALEVALI